MAIAYRSHTVQNNSGSGTITINKPSGVIDGDLLIAFFSEDSDSPRITASGWTAFSGTGIGASGEIVVGTSAVLQCFYKVASSEGASWNFTPSASYTGVVGVIAYSGVDTTTPIDVAAGATPASSTTHASASITPSVINTMLVGIWMIDSNGANTWSTGDMNERVDQSTGSSAFVTLSVHDLIYGSTSAVTKTATFTASDAAAVLIIALKPASSGVTGDASITQAADTASAAGAVAIAGAGALTQGADTLSSAGTVEVAGAANITQAADTTSATGAVDIVGAASITQGADTLSADGTVGAAGITGEGAITQAPDTLSATGTVAIAGAASITQAADTASSVGAVDIAGAASITQGADTLSAAGGSGIVGDAAITQGANTLSAAGTVAIAGTTSITQAGDTTSAAGAVAIVGAAAMTQGADTLVATGTGVTTLAPFGRHTFRARADTAATIPAVGRVFRVAADAASEQV